MKLTSSIVRGHVTHQRVSPVRHKLRYGVFSLLVDLDAINDLDRNCRLFSHNRSNLLSFHDRDLADGRHTNLASYARDLVKKELEIQASGPIHLLTYPRVLGYVFNPLSVYFCHDKNRELVAAIYEVSNTFGERTTYVCRVENGRVANAKKQMLVSPFNGTEGEYGFRIGATEDELTIGVELHERGRAIINTWFRGKYRPFSDRQIIYNTLSIPLMTLKVIAAIHYEALKLWLKGLRPSWSTENQVQPVAPTTQPTRNHSSKPLIAGE